MIVVSLRCDVCLALSDPEKVHTGEYQDAVRILASENRIVGWRRRGGVVLCPSCARIDRTPSLVPPGLQEGRP